MDLSFFFQPIESNLYLNDHEQEQKLYLGHATDAYIQTFPDWQAADVVVFGCNEYRGNLRSQETEIAADRVREFLYALASPSPRARVADLGNLSQKDELEETYDAVTYITEVLLRAGKTVILIGGSQDLTYAQYRGFEKLEENIEYVSIDSMPDILDSEIVLSNRSHHHKIITHSPNFLEQMTFIGVQGYFMTEPERQALKSLGFDVLRVGELHTDLTRAEPYLRSAQMVSFDLSAVRHAESPGSHWPSPAGFSVEEFCSLARYSGMGYGASALNFTEIYPGKDPASVTAHTAALGVWFFMEGFYNRRNDFPAPDRSNLTKYRVPLSGPIPELVFYQNDYTKRWWMEVPSPDKTRNRRGRSILVPCSQADYETALQSHDIPERWWNLHLKM